MKLDRILGQEHLKKKIYDSIEKKMFPQSKILVDRDGYGGLNFAIEIARGLLEVDKNYKGEILNHPDLYFSYPTFADKQTSPDLLDSWIDLIKKNVYIDFNDWKNISTDSKGKIIEGKIRKAEIDLIFSKAHLKSFVGGAKVFIIWNMQQLDNYGQNKLLKLLEEPPNETFFIIVTESLDSLLPTIISRCQISNLIPVNFDEQKYFLENLVDNIDYDLIVKSSRGSVSRGMNYINENASSISHEQNFVDCLRFAFLAKKSKKAVLDLTKWSEKISSNPRMQQKEFLDRLNLCFKTNKKDIKLLSDEARFFRGQLLLNYLNSIIICDRDNLVMPQNMRCLILLKILYFSKKRPFVGSCSYLNL